MSSPKKWTLEYSPKELYRRKFRMASAKSTLDRKKFEKEFDVTSLNLSQDHLDIWNQNPHIRQVFANGREFHRENKSLLPSDRILDDNSPMTPYQRRQGEAKTVEHWGQRKLIMSEIEFLTNYGDPSQSYRVIYAGAAPGTHIYYLSTLFPNYDFLLVDPSKFTLNETDRITIIQDFFTDELAHQCFKESQENSQSILFISDIRSQIVTMPEKEKEESVIVDMEIQKKWHEIMNPLASMLKFRLPYEDGKTSYLNGLIYLPVWGGRTTTETRLIVERSQSPSPALQLKEYDHVIYGNMMFHFNTITRTSYFEHDVIGEGLDHCFDCASEILILRIFLKKFPEKAEVLFDSISKEIDDSNHPPKRLKLEQSKPNDENFVDLNGDVTMNFLIAKLSKEISQQISEKGRTLRP